mgnify:CR=1 FL=1
MAAVNHKDTYKASAVFLIVMGMLYLIDKFYRICFTRVAMGYAERQSVTVCSCYFPLVQGR